MSLIQIGVIMMPAAINPKIITNINRIARFLARRDIDELDPKELDNKFGLTKVDLLIILGNSNPYTAELGAVACKNGLASKLMIVGGIGHSTKYLVESISRDKYYQDIDVEDKAEADILKQVAMKFIDKNQIIIENKSTNCGSNAIEALKVLQQKDEVPQSILLIQDPTMQLRSHASFQKVWEKERPVIVSYAPFIPQVELMGEDFGFVNSGVKGLWSKSRFIDLIMGEIPRLLDNEHGYGPKGKGFIEHVDIPDEVLHSYERLLLYYTEYSEIRERK